MGQHNINLDFETEKIQRDFFKGSQTFSKWVSEQIKKLKDENLTSEETKNKIKEKEMEILKLKEEIKNLNEHLNKIIQKEQIEEENNKELYFKAMQEIHTIYINQGRGFYFDKGLNYWSEKLKIPKEQFLKDILGESI